MFWNRAPPAVTYEYQSAIAHRVRDIMTGADHARHHKHLAGRKNKMAIKALQRPEALAGVIDILRTMPDPLADAGGEEDDDSDHAGESTSADASELASINSGRLKTQENKDTDKGKGKATELVAASASASSPSESAAMAPAPTLPDVKVNGAPASKGKASPDKTVIIGAAVTGALAAATVVTTAVVERPVFYPPTDIVSSQAFWWGYEVYIPQKVFSRIAAAQDVSTAFLGFLSTVGLMVPAIVPFLGYIAAYVGLEFAVIKAQNEGKGVILASTWLLPVALVPRAWDIPDPVPKDEEAAEAIE